MDLHIRGIHKSFDGFPALTDVNLDIASGELIALLGPSGSGKTTLLRVIAGLEFPDSGQVLFGDKNMATHPVRERGVGFVFQHYALFKHMSVLDNIAFGLRVRKRSERPAESKIRAKALELLDLVQLSGLENRYPAQLSGGQRQRVALARALAIDPSVLLLDEPFGALDARVRKDLRRWLRELHEKTGYTTVFVTHDQEEAMELADRVVVMNRGRIEQVGSTDELYEQPASPFVFDFLGDTNILPIESLPHLAAANTPTDVYVRPGDLRVADGDTPGVDVEVLTVQRTGPTVRATVVTTQGRQTLNIAIPHLHHDVPRFVSGKTLRLRLMQHSLFPRGPSAPAVATPLARETRTRGRLG